MRTSAKTALAVIFVLAVATSLTSVTRLGAQETAAPKPAEAPADQGATGTWKWTVQGFGGNDVEVVLKLKQDGEKLTGTISGFGGQDNEIKDGTIKDGKVSFKTVREFGGTKSTTTYTATLADGGLKGKSETVWTRDFEAKRQ